METMIEMLKRAIKNNRGTILVIVIILAVVFIVGGGWIYYTSLYAAEPQKCMAMSLQNLVETLLFNPIVTIEKMTAEKGFFGNLSAVKRVWIVFFSAAVIIVPALELFTVYHIFNRFLHIVLSNPLATKRHLLIVGYNSQVLNLLKNSKNDFKVYLWTDKSLKNEQKIELAELKVYANTNETPLGMKGHSEELIKRFNKYLESKYIEDVLIMQESDTENIEYYMVLSSCDICRVRNIHFHVKINHFASKLTLQEYFDQQLKHEKDKKSVVGYKPLKMDLRIFNPAMIQAEEVFHILPLFRGTKEKNKYDVHLMIAGDDSVACEMLLTAMNQAVITDTNNIFIDVYGKNIDYVRKILNERFNHSYVRCTSDSYFISSDRADGNLMIQLIPADLSTEKAIDEVKNNNQANPYTYIVCCLKNPDENLQFFRQLRSVFTFAPIVLRVPYTRQLKAHLNKQLGNTSASKKSKDDKSLLPWDYYNSVYLMGTDIEYLKLSNIIDIKEETKIREFNYRYLDIMGKTSEDRNEDWNGSLYYKRQSNRFLYNHLLNKLFMAVKASADFEKDVNDYWKDEVEGIKDSKTAGTKQAESNQEVQTVNTSKVQIRSEDLEQKVQTGEGSEAGNVESSKMVKEKAVAKDQSAEEQAENHTDQAESELNNAKNTVQPDGKEKTNIGEKTADLNEQTVNQAAQSANQKDERENKEVKMSEELLSSNLLSFAKTEHRRFCYAYASEGWGYTPGDKDETNLLHDCLCSWEILRNKDTTKQKLVYDATSAREVLNLYRQYGENLKTIEKAVIHDDDR